jgi:Na+/proline symporter
MGIGASIFLIAVGAILAFAVNAEISGLDIEIVGWILMGAGVLGLLLSLIFWSSWGGRRRTGASPYDEPPY